MHFDEARRRFLYQSLVGLGGIALMDLLNGDLCAAPRVNGNPLAPKQPHHAPKAKSCIFLTMLGGVSQMDTFDPKPALDKFDNTVMDWSKEKAHRSGEPVRETSPDPEESLAISRNTASADSMCPSYSRTLLPASTISPSSSPW